MAAIALTALDYAGIAGGVAAALTLLGSARRVWARTLGRRWDITRRLNRLGTGAQLDFFQSVLGEPPVIRRTFTRSLPDWEEALNDEEDPPIVEREFVECFFVDPLYFVQTVSDHEGTVVGFSITTRSRRFHPALYLPPRPPFRTRVLERLTFERVRAPRLGRVELGRSSFDQALGDDWGFPRIRSWLGARAWSYSEIYYCGNPAHYQDFVFTTSSAAPFFRDDPSVIEEAMPGAEPWLATESAPEDWLEAAPPWIEGLVSTVSTSRGMSAGAH